MPNLMIRVLSSSPEHEFLYHNHELKPFRSSIPLLFAYLTWAIAPCVDGFVDNGKRCRLLVSDKSVIDSEGFFPAEECAK